jgi:signal transduction histidine kinase
MGTIGDVIARHHSEIVRMWVHTAQRSPSARELSGAEVASTIPAYLSLLADGDPAQLSDEQRRLVEHHMSSRLRNGFNLNEILTEYASLARYVFELMEKYEAPLAESARLASELLTTSQEVTKIFNEQLLEDEQPLKRYLRLLQNVASDAVGFHEHALSVRERLTRALELVMEAMEAHTAALLLFDPKSGELIMSAATGDAHEHLAAHVSAHDLASFAGKIAAAEGEPVALADAATSELGVTDTLRASGIHSLLGVRLSAHHLLRGVLYVGIRQKRSFTASEVRRLESLGETLTIHLDNARLYATLRETITQGAVSDEMSKRFVSLLMHDLKVPLTAARAAAQRISDGGSPAEAVSIAQELDRMQGMIEDLLDAHRLRGGARLKLRIGECDLAAVAAGVVGEQRLLHGERFVLRVKDRVRGMWDGDQLRRALSCLIANALKHGDAKAPVSISISGGSDEATLAVHNAGRAISPDDQARLFRPFSRDRLMANKPGWGLGLTLVWGCAEAHGGHVDVKSAPDAGTTFTLCIPWDARPYADG